MRKLIIGALVVAVGVGVSIGVVFASDSSNTEIRASVSTANHPFHRVMNRRANVTASSLPKRGFIYFETEPFTLPPNTLGGSTGKCPRRWKAINGYFASNTRRVVPIENYVGGSPRKWTIVTVNEGLSNAQVYVGIVCGRIRR